MKKQSKTKTFEVRSVTYTRRTMKQIAAELDAHLNWMEDNGYVFQIQAVEDKGVLVVGQFKPDPIAMLNRMRAEGEPGVPSEEQLIPGTSPETREFVQSMMPEIAGKPLAMSRDKIKARIRALAKRTPIEKLSKMAEEMKALGESHKGAHRDGTPCEIVAFFALVVESIEQHISSSLS